MGWWGEGYWFHKWIPGLNWDGCTLVAKTTTNYARRGNMPMTGTLVKDWTKAYGPKEWLPRCVIVKPWDAVILNSVGLSGPGAKALFEEGQWQRLTKPFFLSFMSVAGSKNNRIFEAEVFVDRLIAHADSFKAPFGLQVNLPCVNTGHDSAILAEEAREILEVFQFLREIGIPIVPKFNVLLPVEAVVDLQDLCDAVCISNTIPWGKCADTVNWIKLFPGKKGEEIDPMLCNPITGAFAFNPLKRRGINGGGLSGAPLLQLVYKWVKQARTAGIDLPINAGGGILRPKDVDVLVEAGADSVFLGSIAILRGWRVQKTIKRAHKLLGSDAT